MPSSYIKKIDKEINSLLKAKKKAPKLKSKTLYKWFSDSTRHCFIGYFNGKKIDLLEINMRAVGINALEMNDWTSKINCWYVKAPINSLKEVPKEDLPLYINWATTKQFEKLIKSGGNFE